MCIQSLFTSNYSQPLSKALPDINVYWSEFHTAEVLIDEELWIEAIQCLDRLYEALNELIADKIQLEDIYKLFGKTSQLLAQAYVNNRNYECSMSILFHSSRVLEKQKLLISNESILSCLNYQLSIIYRQLESATLKMV